ncbi:Hemolysin-type calcium-binding repeat-containing protein [Roseomonas rosea]|uniref:Hemolysin-type calcium-binding repeat-containing protein n=1 Tax=Muricoccus roseus TaxID=198092 RepID=A0A1M6I351_9PROT|nr:calcium-binding protein [Roseomonas rosea]SHJ28828.1 Hemolysin-type calcium-binding repeat-containing protein [Roseomonas rosea]
MTIYINPSPAVAGTSRTDLFLFDDLNRFLAAGPLDGGAGADGLVFLGNVTLTDSHFASLRNMEGLLLDGAGAQSLTLGANAALAFTDGRVAILAPNAASLFLRASALPMGGNLFVLAGDGNDTLIGGAGRDALHGGAGNDLILGGGDMDTLLGSEGDDTLRGDAGNDVLLGGDGHDSLLGGDGDDRLFGEAGDDTLLGGNGHDLLEGRDGTDRLDGGTGADTMFGGLGDDRYIVDDAGDLAIELEGGGTDTVVSSVSFTIGLAVESLTLNGNAAVSGTGNAAANRILGNAGHNLLSGMGGKDTLIGGAGDDTLIGGAAADRLTGDAGADAFRYAVAAEGADSITDFLSGTDRIEVSAAGFGGGLAEGMDLLATGHFAQNTTGRADAPFGTGQFIFETDTPRLWWDADGAGGSAAVLVAGLSGAFLQASDIQVIA